MDQEIQEAGALLNSIIKDASIWSDKRHECDKALSLLMRKAADPKPVPPHLYKWEVWYHISHGGTGQLMFKKIFELPFIPSYGMKLDVFSDDRKVNYEFYLQNNQPTPYRVCSISYYTLDSYFEVGLQLYENVRLTQTAVDEYVSDFTAMGWEIKSNR